MPETLSDDIPDELGEAVERVLRRACDADLTIATAESCTGGLLASLLTDVQGCSHAFECGFVVYTEAAKSQMLGVPGEMIGRHGAVSEEVARAMAEGALARSEADVALSVTGFAGPGGDDEEEGLVHLACARLGRETAHLERRYGAIGRGPIRIRSLCDAVAMIEGMLD